MLPAENVKSIQLKSSNYIYHPVRHMVSESTFLKQVLIQKVVHHNGLWKMCVWL